MTRAFLVRWAPLAAFWLIWCVFAVLRYRTEIAGLRLHDPDDYLRLVEVRDWMAGQSWFDVRQYRVNPPLGGDMHWSRLVDVPIALAMLVAGLVVDRASAEILALVAVPLILFGVTMVLMARIGERLGDRRLAILSAGLLPTAMLLSMQFAPLRIDHHGWQIVMAGIALWMLLRGPWPLNAALCGAALALWMHISLEGLPYAAAFGAVYAWRAMVGRREPLAAFLVSLTLSSLAIALLTRPAALLLQVHCDAVSWPLIAGMAIPATAALAVAYRGRRWSALIVGLALGAAALAGGIFYLAQVGSCAVAPFSGLDPLVRRFWYLNIGEGLSIAYQPAPVAALLVAVPLFGLAGTALRLRGTLEPAVRENWIVLGALMFASALVSLTVARAGGVAHFYAMPGVAWLAIEGLRRTRGLRSLVLRVPATAAVIVAVTPLSPLLAVSFLDSRDNGYAREEAAEPENACDYAALHRVPTGTIFAGFDLGPRILVETSHNVVATSHHRNQAAMKTVILGFLSKPDKARPLVAGSGADYLLLCRDLLEPKLYAAAAPEGLAARLLAGDRPGWLEPIAAPDGVLLYRVRRQAP